MKAGMFIGIILISIIWVSVVSVTVWVVNAHMPQQTITPFPRPVATEIVLQATETPWPIPTGEQPTPITYNVPPDPGHGPIPYCWTHPGQGLAPGATCPPRR